MKIILLQKIKLFLLGISLLLVSANILAETEWEVGAIFLGKNEDTSFKKDISTKLSELANIKKNTALKITTLIEDINPPHFEQFFKDAFQNKKSKKLLFIYSHGLGPFGLKNYSTPDLKEKIFTYAPHLDLIWYDACFMANLEFLYEMRHFSDYTIASEDAEFSSGLSLSELNSLTEIDSSEKAAQTLAENFINSYSYTKNGNLRQNALISSATISVIENKKLDTFVPLIKNAKIVFDSFPLDDQRKIISKIQKKYSMDNHDLLDLGHLLIELRAQNDRPDYDKLLTEIIRKSNINSIKSIKSNPRFKIKNDDHEDRILVWGFNQWQAGSESDFKNKEEIFMPILKPDGFITGPDQKKWPYKKMAKNQSTSLTPFAPGLNQFHYYWSTGDGIKISGKQNNSTEEFSLKRNSDFVESQRATPNSPVVYSGHTEEIGNQAEKYTGINISSPLMTSNIDYFDFEFNQLVEWLKL